MSYKIIKNDDSMKALFEKHEKKITLAFTEFVASVDGALSLTLLEDLFISGNIDELIKITIPYSEKLANVVLDAYTDAATVAAAYITDNIDTLISFDRVNHFAVQQMSTRRFFMIQQISQGQRDVISQVLHRSLQTGQNPVDAARQFKEALGLTAKQEASVERYKQMLREGNTDVFNRELRDRRFDNTIRTSFDMDGGLDESKVNQMGQRYRERYINFRSRVIGRTESLSAVHEGSAEMYRQAFENGVILPSEVIREWVPSSDERTRDSHASMARQTRDATEAFVSGLGNSLQFPGDRNAPPQDTIQCRCVVITRIKS